MRKYYEVTPCLMIAVSWNHSVNRGDVANTDFPHGGCHCVDHMGNTNLTVLMADLKLPSAGFIRSAAMSIKLTITSEMEKVAKEYNRTLAPLTDDLVLLDSGLDSLAFAVLVVRLEGELGVDPFSAAEDAAFPVTLRDFVAVYENAAKQVAA
jgi:acyl carrier protein